MPLALHSHVRAMAIPAGRGLKTAPLPKMRGRDGLKCLLKAYRPGHASETQAVYNRGPEGCNKYYPADGPADGLTPN